MSLRYKALIAVIMLVAFLTSFLVVSSSALFEQDARERIHTELLKDQRILDERITFAAQVSRQGMRASAADQGLVEFLRDARFGDFGDNLRPFAEDWRNNAGADVAIFAFETYTAEERKGKSLARVGEDLAVVFFSGKQGFDAGRRDLILADQELCRFMADFFKPAWDAGTAKGLPTSQAAVLPIAGRVYLCVQNYLWVGIQDLEPAGVGVVLTELSRDWLKSASSEEDEIEKIVFAGPLVASTTLPEGGMDADDALRRATELGAITPDGSRREYEFEIDGETRLGVAFSSALSPPEMPHRPGFIAFKSLEAELESFVLLRRRVFMIGGVLGLLAAVLAYFGAYSVIAKLRRLQDATGKIREGRFDTQVTIRGRDELAKLGKAFNDMTTGLKALGMYTHDTLARSLLDNPQLLNAPSMRAEGSIFFSDIKGFTSISEGLSAEDLTSQLNEYFAAIGRKLKEQRGYVDKFIGDAIMAFWGPPFITERDYAVRACESALAALRIAGELRQQWKAQGRPLFFQRIGIATGEVVVGNIGTETKKNFTVIGDSVNLASRLEGANKLYGTEILVDERTFELARHAVAFREIDQILVVGKQQPVRVYLPLAMLAEAAPVDDGYAAALHHYRAREFGRAIELLEALLKRDPDDGPAQWLREQSRELQRNLPPGWEPVTTATSK
jgi:class 3 adenylate cyclase